MLSFQTLQRMITVLKVLLSDLYRQADVNFKQEEVEENQEED